MTTVNPVISLKNFRSFGEESGDFELAPITVLTGCNSAGKSSMAKAIMLLNRLPKSRNSISPALKLFSKDLGLGCFEKVLNKQANENEVVISYKIWSNYLQEAVLVKRYFKAKRIDTLNDGYMCRYRIEKTDGIVILEEDLTFDGIGEETTKNIESIRPNFNDFDLVSRYCSLVQLEELLKLKQYKDRLCELKEAKKQIKTRKIDFEAYDVVKLNQWSQWLNSRNKVKEKLEKECEGDDDLALSMAVSMEEHFSEDATINHFLDLVADEVFAPWFTSNVEYIDSASAAIRRIYSVEDTNKMSDAIRVFNSRRLTDKEFVDHGFSGPNIHRPGQFVNHWIKEFIPGANVEIAGDNEGGVKVYLNIGNEKRLLADEGYGITQLVALLLHIDNAICMEPEIITPWNNGKPDNKCLSLDLPEQLICVEEPEIHLHPKYQSLLANMFVEAYKQYNIRFIIETHSEYLIRKLQVLVADKEKGLSTNDVSINYVGKTAGVSKNRKIEILNDGRLSEAFGTGFFDEADNRAMDLLHLKASQK